MKLIFTLFKRMTVCHPFFYAILFFCSSYVHASEFENKILRRAFESTIHLKTKKSKLLLKLANQPNSAFHILIENYNDCYNILLTEDYKNSDEVIKRINDRIEKIESLELSKLDENFFVAELQLHQSLINFFFNHKLEGLLKLKSAYNKTQSNRKANPNYKPSIKSEAYLNLILGSTPSDLKWFLKKFGLKGDYKAGMERIKLIANSSSIFSIEAKFLDVIASSYIIDDFDYSLSNLNEILDDNPTSLTANLIAALVHLKQNNNDETLSALNKIPSGPSYAEIPTIDFLKGEVNLFKGNYSIAALHYYKFVFNHNGKNLIKTSYYRLFQCNYLLGNKKLAESFLKSAEKYGQKILESDKYAHSFSERKQLPTIGLLKVRLFTDGGYMAKAQKVLKQININMLNSKFDLCEYYYRLARIEQLTKERELAIKHYKKTAELQTWEEDYFKANSYLQLGYIYNELDEEIQATYYFKKAQSCHNHPYEQSIIRKAKAEVKRLK